MGNRIISYDLGTGGNKASLYDFEAIAGLGVRTL